MNKTKKLVLAGLCIALGIVLPIAFHSVPDAGRIFLPMHIPVLLCGLICGWQYGFVCGIVTPALSSLLTGMPATAILPGMICELAIYGLVSGLLMHKLNVKSYLLKLYVSLVAAMLCGRLAAGALNAVLFQAGRYSLSMWISASFVVALPGIAIQLLLIPLLVFALKRAKLL